MGLTKQIVTIWGRGGGGGGHLFQLEKGGPNVSKGDRLFQKILVPPDHFFGPEGLFLHGGTNCYVTGLSRLIMSYPEMVLGPFQAAFLVRRTITGFA